MLYGYQFPNVASWQFFNSPANVAPIFNSTSYYGLLADKRPGVKLLLQQTGGTTITFTITTVYNTTDGSLDINTQNYPYVLVGAVNIGNRAYEGQLLPSVQFQLNGKWGTVAIPAVQARLGPTGYASAWAVVPRSSIVGSTPTTQLLAGFTGDFRTSFGNFGIGEIVMVGCDEIPLKSVTVTPMDPTANNRSGFNVPYLSMRRGYRKTVGVFAPRSREDALILPTYKNMSRSLQQIIFTAARNGGSVIAPLWRPPGSTLDLQLPSDATTLMENCHFARLVSPLPPISGNANEGWFNSTFNWEELL